MTLFLNLILLINFGLNPKSCECHTQIVYEVTENVSLYLRDSNLCDKDLYYFGDSATYIINISDCMGLSVINKYDINNILISTCYFTNGLDTLAEYGIVINYLGEETSIYVNKYFKPLPHGEWLYFTKTGSIEKREIYSKGILLDTKFE